MTLKSIVQELPNSTEYQSLLKPPKTKGLHSGRVFLNPGFDCGLHNTGSQEEMLIFLSGKGQAVIEKKVIAVEAGQFAYIPPKTEHNIINNTDEPLIYIFCVAPVGTTGTVTDTGEKK
ncbi:MAG: cupin domain-containing protein [Planctomycetaceae bacterium]|nr:cupin domain-containing protein [Planctomycetaceae bacterium]